MTIRFKARNRLAARSARPWAIVNKRGQVIRCFTTRYIAERHLDAYAPGWRLAA
jgi:hypothetical protein